MRRMTIIFVVALTMFGCKSSMNVKQLSLDANLASLDENESVVDFRLDAAIPDTIEKIKVGEFKIRDGGITVNCSYESVLDLAKRKARDVGGNVVKITEHKLPSPWWSTCHQLDFIVYKIEDVSPFETQVHWTPRRKLSWKDFKDAPKLSLPFYTCLFISANFNSEKLFSTKGHFSVKPVFNTECSWVQPPYRTKNGLELANLHFDLTQVYATKISKAFSEKKLETYDMWQKHASAIYKELNREYETEVYNLYTETSYGNNTSELIAWKFQIQEQLKKS